MKVNSTVQPHPHPPHPQQQAQQQADDMSLESQAARAPVARDSEDDEEMPVDDEGDTPIFHLSDAQEDVEELKQATTALIEGVVPLLEFALATKNLVEPKWAQRAMSQVNDLKTDKGGIEQQKVIFVGLTGSGKSSIINSTFELESLLPSQGNGTAVTSFPVEIVYGEGVRATFNFFTVKEVHDQLNTVIEDATFLEEPTELSTHAVKHFNDCWGTAFIKIKQSEMIAEEAPVTVTQIKDYLGQISPFVAKPDVIEGFLNVQEKLQRFFVQGKSEEKLWVTPLVKKCVIEYPSPHLNGLTGVDLPGFGDSSSARSEQWKIYIQHAGLIVLVAQAARAAALEDTHKVLDSLLISRQQLALNGQLASKDGELTELAFLVTHGDSLASTLGLPSHELQDKLADVNTQIAKIAKRQAIELKKAKSLPSKNLASKIKELQQRRIDITFEHKSLDLTNAVNKAVKERLSGLMLLDKDKVPIDVENLRIPVYITSATEHDLTTQSTVFRDREPCLTIDQAGVSAFCQRMTSHASSFSHDALERRLSNLETLLANSRNAIESYNAGFSSPATASRKLFEEGWADLEKSLVDLQKSSLELVRKRLETDIKTPARNGVQTAVDKMESVVDDLFTKNWSTIAAVLRRNGETFVSRTKGRDVAISLNENLIESIKSAFLPAWTALFTSEQSILPSVYQEKLLKIIDSLNHDEKVVLDLTNAVAGIKTQAQNELKARIKTMRSAVSAASRDAANRLTDNLSQALKPIFKEALATPKGTGAKDRTKEVMYDKIETDGHTIYANVVALFVADLDKAVPYLKTLLASMHESVVTNIKSTLTALWPAPQVGRFKPAKSDVSAILQDIFNFQEYLSNLQTQFGLPHHTLLEPIKLLDEVDEDDGKKPQKRQKR